MSALVRGSDDKLFYLSYFWYTFDASSNVISEKRFVFVSIQQAKEDEDRGVRNGDSASIAGSDLEGPTADSIRMVGIRKAPGEHLGITVKENEKGELAIARFVFAGEINIKWTQSLKNSAN